MIDTSLLLLMNRGLLLLARGFQWRQVLPWHDRTNSATAWAKHHLRLTWLRREGTVSASHHAFCTVLLAQWPWLRHRLDCCAHGRRHPDRVRIVSSSAFNPVTWRQECVEALNQLWIARKQLTHPSDDAWSIDCAALEVLHYIQEAVVHVWMVRELDLDLVEIAERVVQDGLLSLTLSLSLAHLLLLLLLLSSLRLLWSERHQ